MNEAPCPLTTLHVTPATSLAGASPPHARRKTTAGQAEPTTPTTPDVVTCWRRSYSALWNTQRQQATPEIFSGNLGRRLGLRGSPDGHSRATLSSSVGTAGCLTSQGHGVLRELAHSGRVHSHPKAYTLKCSHTRFFADLKVKIRRISILKTTVQQETFSQGNRDPGLSGPSLLVRAPQGGPHPPTPPCSGEGRPVGVGGAYDMKFGITWIRHKANGESLVRNQKGMCETKQPVYLNMKTLCVRNRTRRGKGGPQGTWRWECPAQMVLHGHGHHQGRSHVQSRLLQRHLTSSFNLRTNQGKEN